MRKVEAWETGGVLYHTEGEAILAEEDAKTERLAERLRVYGVSEEVVRQIINYRFTIAKMFREEGIE
jgi:hypothetical protein